MNKIYTYPNGYSIRYALAFDTKGNKLSRFRRAAIDNKPFEKAINSEIKLRLPLLDLDTAYDFPIVAADFDHLPDDFMDWDHFEQYLTQTYSDKGLVIRTPSGKCKVLFQLKMPSGAKLNRLDRVATLKALLLPEDFPWIDDVPTALTKVYLTKEMLPKLQNWKPQFFVPILKKLPKPLSFSELEAKYTFQSLTDEFAKFDSNQVALKDKILELLRGSFKRMNVETLDRIAIYMVKYKQGICVGFHINQKLMGTMIGIPQSNVSKLLRKLVELGWLYTDGSYCTSIAAKKYSARGLLRQTLGHVEINVKEIISQEVPEGGANKHYLMVNRKLQSAGFTKEQTLEFLQQIDNRRPTPKQRPSNYFKQLVNSWSKS
jgi:hypothetical protein